MWPGGSAQNPPHPALRRVLADELNHLWIQEYTLPGQGGGNPVRTVFDPEGHVLGETPTGLRVYQIGEDYILCYGGAVSGPSVTTAPAPNPLPFHT